MRLEPLKPGKYVVAVSGGVDSVVLLHMLQSHSQTNVQLIVAHLDHGIRQDSHLDRKLVGKQASDYGLVFEYSRAKLGPKTSEAKAREVRYSFLEEVKSRHQAKAIITAHHQDDLIETAILNLLRGSNRHGLTSLNSKQKLRPLLNTPKQDLVDYAKQNSLDWREDSTNQDLNYLRNYIRHNIVPKLDASARSKLLEIINRLAPVNDELDDLITELIKEQSRSGELDRKWFNRLTHSESKEVLAGWLRQNDIHSYDKLTLDRLSVAAKVASKGQSFPIKNRHSLDIKTANLALGYIER